MNSPTRYTFKKDERLTKKSIIDQVFKKKGKRISAFPLSLISVQTELPSSYPAQLLISVPKKKIRKAVHRNRIKRQIRESYRMQKHRIYEALGNEHQMALAVVYLHNDLKSYKTINRSVKELIDGFIKGYSKNN